MRGRCSRTTACTQTPGWQMPLLPTAYQGASRSTCLRDGASLIPRAPQQGPACAGKPHLLLSPLLSSSRTGCWLWARPATSFCWRQHSSGSLSSHPCTAQCDLEVEHAGFGLTSFGRLLFVPCTYRTSSHANTAGQVSICPKILRHVTVPCIILPCTVSWLPHQLFLTTLPRVLGLLALLPVLLVLSLEMASTHRVEHTKLCATCGSETRSEHMVILHGLLHVPSVHQCQYVLTCADGIGLNRLL